MQRRVSALLFALIAVCLLGAKQQVSGFLLSTVYEKAVELIIGPRNSPRVEPDKEREAKRVFHYNGVSVADHSVQGLPKVRIGHRVIDLFNGMHFDDLLQDTPDEIRPPGVVLFYDSNSPTCMDSYNKLNFDSMAENELPSRERLLTARYDMYSAPKRAWYEFTPEMDLASRFKVDSCPQAVFVPRSCNGFTVWCERGKDPKNEGVTVLGCKDFEEQCKNTVRWNGLGSLKVWIEQLVFKEGEPQISPFFGTFKEQGLWMQKRDYTTNHEHFRNTYMSQAFPAFAEQGFKAMQTPPEFQQWLLDFHKRNEEYRRTENWHGESTQLSFHEVKTAFIDLDRERLEKERMAREYIQPIVEKWSNMSHLELTSFYGIREYPEGSWLRMHIDRTETHVLSITFSVDKRDVKPGSKPWPLRVTDWNGHHVTYDHPPGTMILYESSKLPHGRPTRNEEGVHLGCFMHFKPSNMNGQDVRRWEDIARRAANNIELHAQHASFRQSPVREPTNPIYSKVKYGDATIWKHLGERDDENQKQDGSFTVEFKNQADRGLQVFWYHVAQPEPVLQGKAWPGAKFEINTYEGHTFYWADIDSKEPLPGGRFTIDPGQRVYTYNLKKDGNPVTTSKWANLVKEKIASES